MSASIRLADIFKASFDDYLNQYGKLHMDHYKAVNAIVKCRTEPMGSHEYECDNCHEHQIHFHSCRNRHCPRCQGYASIALVS